MVVQFGFPALCSPGVILTAAVLQAEGRILRDVPLMCPSKAPREIPHPAEQRRVRDDAIKKETPIRTDDPNFTSTKPPFP
jgi:hypothetical protein